MHTGVFSGKFYSPTIIIITFNMDATELARVSLLLNYPECFYYVRV